jgi:hypothetical protein
VNGQVASIAGRPAEGGVDGSSDHVAAFLHEVAGVGKYQRRRAPRTRIVAPPVISRRRVRRIHMHLPQHWPWAAAFDNLFNAAHAPPN